MLWLVIASNRTTQLFKQFRDYNPSDCKSLIDILLTKEICGFRMMVQPSENLYHTVSDERMKVTTAEFFSHNKYN
ncbi:hypothetical protein RclHR1_00320031 [Rhizophagus clarus]|uniref:Uncharacterized protein n=1 Tax=Rhizophagus clarus TaxID=94130 RepID=A0A2Z6S231_9GLOM|nr:hypothetical protein RclHR1_00320031 [Rhizophagus clarus]GET04244.1 hypothetical protein RCL_jg24568.t1 [Rhizophagus clarus]